jgi:galactokinase
MAINPKDPKMIVVGSASWSDKAPCSIYLSRDAGQNWEVINGDLPDGAGASSMTFDPQGQYLYIARYAGSVYKMKL